MLASRGRWSGPPQGVPQLDRADPFARDLIYAGGAGIAPRGQSDGSAYFDRTNGLLANVAQSSGTLHGYFVGDTPDVTATAFGPALVFDGTRKAYTQAITGPANGVTTVDETCLVLCSLGSSSGSQHIFGYGNVWSSSLADYGRGIGIEGGNLLAWGASAQNGKKVTASLPALNRPVCLAARFSASGALFVDGKRVAAGDMSHAWAYYLATGAGVAAIESQEIANFTGQIGLRLWWRRGLSDAEIIEISRNPWRVFRAPELVIFPVASSGTTLSLTDATHGHLADAIALTQQHQLVGSDATHAHGADSVALVQQHQLSAADAAHAHTADAITLTQQHQLATADASHAHTADAVALVQQHAIAIADAMHAHDLDALTLAVQSTLAMSDATHAHGADGVTLSLAGSLAVADATHGHAVDPVALTQQHVLALADALHAHGSDVVTLGTGLALAVADAVHAQTADTLALSQVHLLVLADAAHAHLADTLALVMPGAITTLPDRTLVIAAEHRALVIVTETRALAIGAEARVLTIH